MATALLPLSPPSPSSFCVPTHHSPYLRFFSHPAQLYANGIRGVSSKILAVSPSSSKPISDNTCWVQRRDLMLFALSSSASLVFSFPASSAVVGTEGDLKMATMVDNINAYSFQYPMEVPSKKFVFKWYMNFCIEVNLQL